MSDDGYPASWDGFIAEAEKDDRIGEVNGIVTEVRNETWPDGRARYKVIFILPASGNSKVDATFSDPPSDSELAAVKAAGDRRIIRGTSLGLQLHRSLRQHYGIGHPKDIQVGASMRFKTYKDKGKDGGAGFVRVAAFLPKSAAANTPGGGVGF